MATQYDVSLREELSGPAGIAANAMRKLEREVNDVERALQQMSRAEGRAARATSDLGRSSAGASRGVQGFGSGLRGLPLDQTTTGTTQLTGAVQSFGGASGIGAVAAGALAAAVAAVATAAAYAAGQLAIAVVQAAAFIERTRVGLSAMLGSAEAGAAALNRAIDLAAKYGLEVQSTAAEFQKLIAMRFSPDQAAELIKMTAALGVLGVSGEKAQRVLTAITQIKAKGRVQAEELLQLAEAGISTEAVIEALGKRLNKTTDEIRKMMQAGKITAEDGIAAIHAAVKDVAGIQSYDEALGRVSKTLEGMWNIAKAKLGKVLLDIASRVLPKLSAAATGIFEDFESFMASDTGTGIIDGIVSGFEVMIGAVQVAWGWAKKFAQGFSDGLGVIAPLIGAIGDAIMAMLGNDVVIEGLGTMFRMLGAAVGFAVGMATAAIGVFVGVQAAVAALTGVLNYALGAIWDFGAGLIDGIVSIAGQVVSAAANLGTAMIDGIAQGIKGAASAVIGAITGVVGDAVAQAKAVLGIASPSRVFRELGEQTGAGFAQGVDSSAAGAQNAVDGMLGAPQAGGAAPVAAVGGGGVTINIDTTGAYAAAQTTSDPAAFGAAVTNEIVNKVADRLADLAIQAGLATA